MRDPTERLLQSGAVWRLVGVAIAHLDDESLRRRTCDQLTHRSPKPDDTAVQEGDAVGEIAHFLDPLRRPDHGCATRCEVRDEFAHHHRAVGVEIVGGLVHKQHRRGSYKRSSDREPLLHPVRVVTNRQPCGIRQPDVGEDLDGPAPSGAQPQAVQPGEEDEVLEPRDAEVERAVPGRDQADGTGRVHPTGVGLDETGEDPDQGGLPGSVRTEEGVNLARDDLEIDPTKRGRGPERADDACNLNRWFRRAFHARPTARGGED